MKIELLYGKGNVAVSIDEARVSAIIRKRPLDPVADPRGALRQALEQPIGSPALRDMCAPGKTACIVVSDITRPVPNAVILPVLLGYIESQGIRRSDITLLIAAGMHRPCEEQELIDLLGRDVAGNYQIINHRSEMPSMLEQLGFTANGTCIEVNKYYLHADLKILTGLIEPHFMAGYSGGRKSICPGIMGLDTYRFSHGVLCLSHPRATNCVLEGNPFHEEAVEVAKTAGCDFILNVVLDEQRRITGIFAGDIFAAHQAGCRFVDQSFKVPLENRADIVLTTNAGYPLDINFYQTVKGLIGALPAVKPGGTIIIASRCPEGLGSGRFKALLKELEKSPRLHDFLDAHRENFIPDQWEVQELIKVLDRAHFMIYSEGLSEEEAKLGRGEKISSIEQGLALAFKRHGPDAKVIVIPEGPYVVPEFKGLRLEG